MCLTFAKLFMPLHIMGCPLFLAEEKKKGDTQYPWTCVEEQPAK